MDRLPILGLSPQNCRWRTELQRIPQRSAFQSRGLILTNYGLAHSFPPHLIADHGRQNFRGYPSTCNMTRSRNPHEIFSQPFVTNTTDRPHEGFKHGACLEMSWLTESPQLRLLKRILCKHSVWVIPCGLWITWVDKKLLRSTKACTP